MITRITGTLVALSEQSGSIRIGGFDYEVLLPDIVRRQLQARLNLEVSLRTIEFLEGILSRADSPRASLASCTTLNWSSLNRSVRWMEWA